MLFRSYRSEIRSNINKGTKRIDYVIKKLEVQTGVLPGMTIPGVQNPGMFNSTKSDEYMKRVAYENEKYELENYGKPIVEVTDGDISRFEFEQIEIDDKLFEGAKDVGEKFEDDDTGLDWPY